MPHRGVNPEARNPCNRAERSLLAELANSRGLEPTARIFVEPLAFEARELNSRLARRAEQIAELSDGPVVRRIFRHYRGEHAPE